MPDESYLHQTEQGVFGLEEVIADFSERDLVRLRTVAEAIRTRDTQDVRGAIALAGSAAQSGFQLFPGDCDYFERVHITAPTRAEALAKLVSLMVDTVARVFPHPDLQFTEMCLGLHPKDHLRDGSLNKKGSPIRWSLADVDARAITYQDAEGEPSMVLIHDATDDPGFVKMDWVYADPVEDRVVAVSKVLDATWEDPDGNVIPLDGVIDSFYQEVYLDPDSKAHVEALIDEVKPSGLSEYVEQLQKEIRKYCDPGHANYGKVAKRLYNIFRVTSRPQEAAELRELFDDPAARLYTVPATLHALTQVMNAQRLSREAIDEQLAASAAIIRECYTGTDRDEIASLMESLGGLSSEERDAAAEKIADACNAEVSGYFEERLNASDNIRAYLAEVNQ